MQVPVTEQRRSDPHRQIEFVADFEELWRRAMRGFLVSAQPGDVLVFAPELLGPNYSRKLASSGGELVEESDCYQQALILARLAHRCSASVAETQPDLQRSTHTSSAS